MTIQLKRKLVYPVAFRRRLVQTRTALEELVESLGPVPDEVVNELSEFECIVRKCDRPAMHLGLDSRNRVRPICEMHRGGWEQPIISIADVHPEKVRTVAIMVDMSRLKPPARVEPGEFALLGSPKQYMWPGPMPGGLLPR